MLARWVLDRVPDPAGRTDLGTVMRCMLQNTGMMILLQNTLYYSCIFMYIHVLYHVSDVSMDSVAPALTVSLSTM